jgi:transcriptional regulator with XRE-family HTH domain
MADHAGGDDMVDDAIARALGEELRLAREAQGLNRTELTRRMSSDLSSQALANYEYGIRHCTVVRLVQICHALGVPAMDLLGLALQRARIDLYTNNLQIDLRALAEDDQAELKPLHKWARNRLAENLDDSGVAWLSQSVLEELAFLVGINRTDFIRLLLKFTPGVAPRWLWPRYG